MPKVWEQDMASLNEARALFERFRETRKRGDKIPDELWERAVDEGLLYSVSFAAKTLGLDYYQLAERVKGRKEHSAQDKDPRVPSHSKLSRVFPLAEAQSELVFENISGAKLRISANHPCARELIRMFFTGAHL